ncbi:MAG: S8 family serine peptidase [Micromonosporaceae bacterium]|nr:S8 family serine peptidase [Micromonosporaceae bacterium]
MTRNHPRVLASALAFTLVIAASVASVGAAGAQPPNQAPELRPPAEATAPLVTLTLLTGDQVQVQHLPGGDQAVEIDPAPRDGYAPSFETIERDQDLYVIPSDAAGLVPDLLDRELFNVSKLAGYGYTDGIPVITTSQDRVAAQSAGAVAGATVTADLPSIDGQAVTIDGTDWWRAAGGGQVGAGSGDRAATTGPLAGIDRIWLDEQITASLDVSVPQIGAPEAWDAGFDGTGVTVAVLDTGIDATHPDLASQVAGAENFTTSDTASDRHGHGTHVGGTVAGTGAASGGQYVGVAPGARLLNGKVLGDTGSGQSSWAIAGMQWAADQGADVVNLSLGTDPADGTDPMSQAVNTLTAQHDLLFVIAAGNNGSRDYTIGAPGAADAALTVGSVSKTEQLAATSSRGPRLGDHAVKPDVTAPGVSIVSARAAGTSRGTPVDENYTILSGTSMATPHVAGAAAILRQAEPDLAAGEVKARFAGTGAPRSDLDVYQQGGGRVDVPAALQAPVTATPAPLDLGFFPYPQDGAEPVQAELTYTNRTDQPVTLDLSLAVASRDGAEATEPMLSVAPDQVAIEPGGVSTVTVTLDPLAGETGLYGGYLVAEAAGGQVAARTPVGFYVQPELYQLTVEGIARNGRPATGTSSIGVVDVHDANAFSEVSTRYVDGVATLQVPPGTYSVMGLINTYEATEVQVQDRVMIGDPEVEVTEDTTLVFDARDAIPIEIEAPGFESRPIGNATIGYWRGDALGTNFQHLTTGPVTPFYAKPTDPVSTGGFEFLHRTRHGTPAAALSVLDPTELDLLVLPMGGSAPALDGDDTLPLVFAGTGTEDEYQGVDAAGAVVLVRRTSALTFAAQEANAAAAGARAMIVANNVSGIRSAFVGNAATIPSMTMSMEDGDTLQALLDDGEVTVRLFGTPASSFLFDLVLPEPDRIPDELHYVADPNQLATVENAFHGDLADTPMSEVRHFFRPWQNRSLLISDTVYAGHRRTEYLVPGDTRYQQHVRPNQMFEPLTAYQPGEHRDQTWWKQPAHPGVNEGGAFESGEPTYREADTLQLALAEWVDAHRGHRGLFNSSLYTSAFRMYENGQLTTETARPRGAFPMSPDPAEYRLELDLTRTAEWWLTSTSTRTAWTLQSARPADGEAEIVPLLLVDYDVELDLLNTAPRPQDRRGLPTMDLQVRHQPGAAGPAIAGARLWISYDDGASWLARPVREVGDGEYQAVLTYRPPAGSGFASVRVEAWDAGGNRIDQVINRAWRLPAS